MRRMLLAAMLLVAVAATWAFYRTHLSDREAIAKAKEFLLEMPCTLDHHIEHRLGQFVAIDKIEVLQKSYEGSEAIVQLRVSYRATRDFDDPSREGLCFGADTAFTRLTGLADDDRSGKFRGASAGAQVNLLFARLEDGWWVGGTRTFPYFHAPRRGSDPP